MEVVLVELWVVFLLNMLTGLAIVPNSIWCSVSDWNQM